MNILSDKVIRLGLLALCLAGPTAVWAQARPDTTLYTVVEQMPQFGKGQDDLLAYIGQHIRYPGSAIMQRIEGTVEIGFTISAKGQIENTHLIKRVHPALDKAALELIQTMPPWRPGRQGGQAVPVAYSVPVTFRIGKGLLNDRVPPPTAAQFGGSAEELYSLLSAPPYPAAARQAGASGRTVVVFEVSESGQIRNPHALTPLSAAEQRTMNQQNQLAPLHPALLAAAEAQIAAMPAWQPATNYGTAVASHVMLPVTYRLAPAPTDTVYSLVDQMPDFPGGAQSLTRYLVRHTEYPREARKAKAEGEVLVYFVVNKQGKVEQAEVLRSAHPALDAAALRTINALPSFVPAQHHGRPAKVAYLLPVSFALPSASALDTPPSFIPALNKNFVYPTEALQLGIQGKVFLDFGLDSLGRTHAIRVTKGLHPLLDAEAQAALQRMAPVGAAKAHQLQGLRYTIPILFQLPPRPEQVLADRYATEGLRANPALKPAEYPGGPAALQAFLAAAPYPQAARDQQASGRIFVTITLDEAGWVKQIEPFQSPAAGTSGTAAAQKRAETLRLFYAAAEQHLMEMPQWKPAEWNNKPYATTLTLPLTYYALPPTSPEPAVWAYASEMPVPPAASVRLASAYHPVYPVEAAQAQAQGIVWVYFVVDEQGRATQPAIISSPHPALEAEALRTVNGLRRYTPGRHNGQPVKVAVVAPVPFVIK